LYGRQRKGNGKEEEWTNIKGKKIRADWGNGGMGIKKTEETAKGER